MKTLKNAMASLAIVAESAEPVPVATICKKLGLPRSSASRLMASLRDGGLIDQDPETRRYVPGLLAWRLGVRHRPAGYEADLISEALINITATTGFTTWMATLSGTQIVLLRQNQGVTPIQFSVRLGQTMPAHATAIGKAMLSRLPDRAIESLYEENLTSMTSNTITTRTRLLDELARIRREKLAFSKQEAFPGVISIGGAIFGTVSNSPLGVSISFPVTHGDPEKISDLLRSELGRIGNETGDRFWKETEAAGEVPGATS